jgi:RNA polymerase sigma factor (sigma-70 family)
MGKNTSVLLQDPNTEITFSLYLLVAIPIENIANSPKKMPFFKSTLSQDDLIKGCIRNDRRIQEVLYKQYYQAMMAICISYAKKEEDAVEVLQDGFLKIFQQIEKFDGAKSSLYTWMRTVMVRTAIDFLRKDKKEPQAVEWKEHHDPAIDAEAMQRMSAQQVMHLLQQLPETTRAVFTLFITEGFSHKEIGEQLGISEGTSKWHLSEARKFLTGYIKKQERA